MAEAFPHIQTKEVTLLHTESERFRFLKADNPLRPIIFGLVQLVWQDLGCNVHIALTEQL